MEKHGAEWRFRLGAVQNFLRKSDQKSCSGSRLYGAVVDRPHMRLHCFSTILAESRGRIKYNKVWYADGRKYYKM